MLYCDYHFAIPQYPTKCIREIVKSDTASSCLSLFMEKLSYCWTDFHELHIFVFFSKLCPADQVSLKSHDDQYTYFIYLTEFILEWELFQTKVGEKFITHVLCSITSFKNRAICEIMQKNFVELVRSWMTKTCMRIACWIPKATTTHSKYVVLIAFPLQ